MDAQPRLFQMSLRTLLEVVAVIAVVLAFAYQHVGRERFKLSTIYVPDNGVYVYMYDSSTGQVWQSNGADGWNAFSPLPMPKK
jgi:hypothetical protein